VGHSVGINEVEEPRVSECWGKDPMLLMMSKDCLPNDIKFSELLPGEVEAGDGPRDK